MKIAVLHGAIINAGDFLIKNRAISLLKYFYPDSEIVEYYRNQSLEEKLPEINACDILVFAGGPGYCNGFYPRMAPVTDDLNKTNTEIAQISSISAILAPILGGVIYGGNTIQMWSASIVINLKNL